MPSLPSPKPPSPAPPQNTPSSIMPIRDSPIPAKLSNLFDCQVPALARVVFSCFSNSRDRQCITIRFAGEEILFEGSGENVPMKCVGVGSKFVSFKSDSETRPCIAKFEHHKSAGGPAQASKVILPSVKLGGPTINTISVNSMEEGRPNPDMNDSQLKIDFMFDHPNNPIRICIVPNSRVLISCMANSKQKQILNWMIEEGPTTKCIEGTFEGSGTNKPMSPMVAGSNNRGDAIILEPMPYERYLNGLFLFVEGGKKEAAVVKPQVIVSDEEAEFVAITVNSQGGSNKDFYDTVLRVVAMAVNPA